MSFIQGQQTISDSAGPNTRATSSLNETINAGWLSTSSVFSIRWTWMCPSSRSSLWRLLKGRRICCGESFSGKLTLAQCSRIQVWISVRTWTLCWREELNIKSCQMISFLRFLSSSLFCLLHWRRSEWGICLRSLGVGDWGCVESQSQVILPIWAIIMHKDFIDY